MGAAISPISIVSRRIFFSANPHFAKSALARYTPAGFHIADEEAWHLRITRKLWGSSFATVPPRDILTMLETELHQAGVSIFLGEKIREVRRPAEFVVTTAGSEFHAPALVVATGGLSIPKIGATSFGYDLARQFGIAIREPWPGLVPLVLGTEDRSRFCDLAGVSADVTAACNGQQFREKLLITHRGLSGPAILQISSYWKSRKH